MPRTGLISWWALDIRALMQWDFQRRMLTFPQLLSVASPTRPVGVSKSAIWSQDAVIISTPTWSLQDVRESNVLHDGGSARRTTRQLEEGPSIQKLGSEAWKYPSVGRQINVPKARGSEHASADKSGKSGNLLGRGWR